MSAASKAHTELPWYVYRSFIPGTDGHEYSEQIRSVAGNKYVGGAGEHDAAFIVQAVNAHSQLVEALQECIYEISSNKQFAGSVALEPSANTKRILRKARAALSHLTKA